MKVRENLRLALVVQQAIFIDATNGAAQAWAYLAAHGVPRQTILRVLSNKNQRRATDRSLRPA